MADSDDRAARPDEPSADALTTRPSRPNLLALGRARTAAEELLARRFSEDVIDDDELDRRMEKVQTAASVEALEALVADLEPPGPLDAPPARAADAGGSTALVPASPTELVRVSADAVPDTDHTLCLLGDTARDGAWLPARRNRVINILGDTVLDFREARLGPGEVTVKVRSVLGDVRVIVPPGLPVDFRCAALLSGKKRYTPTPASTDPDAPLVRITGFAALSDVIVEERLPGESKRDAKRRRKRAEERHRREGDDDERQRGRRRRRRRTT